MSFMPEQTEWVEKPWDSANLPAVPTRGRRSRYLAEMLHPVTGQPLTEYQREKVVGLRRSDGSRNLGRLSTRHMAMIAMRVAGLDIEEISMRIGCTQHTVSRILNDPLAEGIIQQVYKDRQKQIDAMAGLVIAAVTSGLKSDDINKKLSAVTKYSEIKKTIASETNPQETAEDFAKALVAAANVEGDLTVNIQQNFRGSEEPIIETEVESKPQDELAFYDIWQRQ